MMMSNRMYKIFKVRRNDTFRYSFDEVNLSFILIDICVIIDLLSEFTMLTICLRKYFSPNSYSDCGKLEKNRILYRKSTLDNVNKVCK